MLNTFYQKIQVIMTLLGLYDGLCDGVWGPKCIEAKRKWELMDEFEPGVPSNGLPFNGRGKLPKGMQYAYKGLDIIWDQWDEVRAQEILKEKGQLVTPELIQQHILGASAPKEEKIPEPVATVNTVQQTPIAASVLDTSKLEDESDEEEEELPDEVVEQVEKPQQNNQNRNWTNKRK